MEHVQVQTAHNVGIRFEVAGLGDRVVAALLDYAVLTAYVLAVLIGLGAADVESIAVFLAALFPAGVYFLVCEVVLDGQSLGKKAVKIKVVRLDGGQPTLGAYLLRWLLRPIDVGLSSGLIGLITILVSGRGQRLGDLAAGTTVVKLRPRRRLGETVFARLEDTHTVTFPQVEALTTRDVETAREVLTTLVSRPRSARTQQLGRKMQAALERKMGIASDLPPIEFLRTVIADYNWVAGRV